MCIASGQIHSGMFQVGKPNKCGSLGCRRYQQRRELLKQTISFSFMVVGIHKIAGQILLTTIRSHHDLAERASIIRCQGEGSWVWYSVGQDVMNIKLVFFQDQVL